MDKNISGNKDTANRTFPAVTEKTTLGELLAILGPIEKAAKTPTSKVLRETAGEPVAKEERCTVYRNGYAVYDNGSGRTVVWLPSCVSFTYHFDKMKDSEKGGEIKETCTLPEGLLESLAWPIAVTLIGDHRIEDNMMNRKGSRAGTKDFDSDDNGDKDGDAEAAMEASYRKKYTWHDGHFGENPEDAYIRKETQEELLAKLTDKQREVFILYYHFGYRQREIAEILNIDRDSVKDRLEGALKKIKKIFE